MKMNGCKRKVNGFCIDQEIDTFVLSIQRLWKDEPLDGDNTLCISQLVLAELDHLNGNCTEAEYEDSIKHTLKPQGVMTL